MKNFKILILALLFVSVPLSRNGRALAEESANSSSPTAIGTSESDEISPTSSLPTNTRIVGSRLRSTSKDVTYSGMHD